MTEKDTEDITVPVISILTFIFFTLISLIGFKALRYIFPQKCKIILLSIAIGILLFPIIFFLPSHISSSLVDGISSFVGFIFYFALDLFEPLFLFFMLPLSRILPMDVIFLTACGTIMLWFYTGLYLCGLIRVLKVNTLLETENKDSFLFAKRVLSFLLKGIFGIAYSIPVLVVIAISLHHACHLVDMLIPLELYEAWGWNIENLF